MSSFVPVVLSMHFNAESMFGMVPGIGTSLPRVWFDSKQVFKGFKPLLHIPETKKKRSKPSKFIKSLF